MKISNKTRDAPRTDPKFQPAMTGNKGSGNVHTRFNSQEGIITLIMLTIRYSLPLILTSLTSESRHFMLKALSNVTPLMVTSSCLNDLGTLWSM